MNMCSRNREAARLPRTEALGEHQMDVRLERVVRSLARKAWITAVNVDWVTLRRGRKCARKDDVKAETDRDRIATRKHRRNGQEVSMNWSTWRDILTNRREALRARLTKQRDAR